MESDIITVEEAALLLRMNPDSVRGMLRRGEIPGYKFGKEWRLSKSRIEEMIRTGQKQE